MQAPPLSPMALQRWAVVDPLLRRLSPGRVLEVGCGLGGFGARLAPRCDYVGVEPDATSFAAARARIEAAGGRAVRALSDVEGSFDLVCAFEVLEHIEDDAGALREWVSKLSAGGHVLLSVPAGAERFGASDSFVGHFRRYDPAQLQGLLLEAGLEVVELKLYAWPLGLVTEAVRNRIAARRNGEPAPASVRSARSGRWMQPGRLGGWLLPIATAPFNRVQLVFPDRGAGLVALARLPS